MAFKPQQSDIQSTLSIEYYPTTASETYVAGELLKLSSGALTKSGATDAPLFIAEASYVAPSSGQQPLAVTRIQKTMKYETTNTAALTSVPIGSKVTIHTDGLQVTATTTSGVAEIVSKSDDAAGSKVVVRF